MSVQVLPAEQSQTISPTAPGMRSLPGFDAGPEPSEADWSLYGNILLELVVAVPLKRITLRNLERIQPGTVIRSSTFAAEGAALSALGVFLANVSLEAADDKLGFRISNFAPMRPRPAMPNSITGLREADTSTSATAPSALLDMSAELSLLFGTRQMQVREAVQLTSGDLVGLEQGLHDPVTLLANGQPFATGTLTLVDECYAVEVLSTEAAPRPAGTEVHAAITRSDRVRLVQP